MGVVIEISVEHPEGPLERGGLAPVETQHHRALRYGQYFRAAISTPLSKDTYAHTHTSYLTTAFIRQDIFFDSVWSTMGNANHNLRAEKTQSAHTHAPPIKTSKNK